MSVTTKSQFNFPAVHRGEPSCEPGCETLDELREFQPSTVVELLYLLHSWELFVYRNWWKIDKYPPLIPGGWRRVSHREAAVLDTARVELLYDPRTQKQLDAYTVAINTLIARVSNYPRSVSVGARLRGLESIMNILARLYPEAAYLATMKKAYQESLPRLLVTSALLKDDEPDDDLRGALMDDLFTRARNISLMADGMKARLKKQGR